MKSLFPLCLFVLSASFAGAQSTPTAKQPSQSVVLLEESDSPVILFDKNEITQAQLAKMDEQNIGDIEILSGEEAKERFGKYEKNGAIVISSTPPADVIQPKQMEKGAKPAPSEQVSVATDEEVKMSFSSDLNAYVLIDGKPSTMKMLDKLDPALIKSMTVVKGDDAIKKYGDVAKDGAVEVITKQ